MLLSDETRNIQEELGEICRTGEIKELPGAKTERLPHYRRLVFNVVNSSLKSAYPITLKILSKEEWLKMVNDFFINHACKSPKIWEMPYEFYEYALGNNFNEKLNKPWLSDLLLFEWLEIEVYSMEDIENPVYRIEGDLLDDVIAINPEHIVEHFEYPVHLESWTELEKKKSNYFVLLYREKATGRVHFISLSPLLAFVFDKISMEKLPARKALEIAGSTFGISDINLLIQNGLPFLNDLFAKDIAIGYLEEV